ncbi:unnamed protein product [Rangifer tarandus platyrhynchus]|uniref:Uncharacterized protein n=1 Tax=Rangifer tarandus platyrhynchus TaxID=3082113 RepID=A0AC59ZSA2_RANTA
MRGPLLRAEPGRQELRARGRSLRADSRCQAEGSGPALSWGVAPRLAEHELACQLRLPRAVPSSHSSLAASGWCGVYYCPRVTGPRPSTSSAEGQTLHHAVV